jgi:ABC-type amino acid transport substrate-binding protein
MCRDNDEDTEKMLDNLRTGKYKALLLDAPVLEYIAATNPACDLYVVGDSFETFNLALEFPADFDDGLIGRMSAAILKLQVGNTTLLVPYLEN